MGNMSRTTSSNSGSVHSAGIDEIHLMPISDIIRPLPPTDLDNEKVESIVDTLKVRFSLSILLRNND